MKFTRPLYRALMAAPGLLPRAKEAFERAKPSYHPITAKMLVQDFAKAEA